MAKTTKKAASKTASEKPVETVVTQPTRRERLKLTDDTLVNVKSTTYGELIYINPRTGSQYIWSNPGDVLTLTVGDIRVMAATQRAFFENQWIVLIELIDDEYADVPIAEVYDALLISQYYKNLLDPTNLNALLKLKDAELKDKIRYLSNGARTNLMVAANTAIQNGSLDSLKVIRTLEEALGCELDRPE